MLGIFVDVETTGLNSRKHRVIEFAMKLMDLGTGAEVDSFETVVQQPQEVWDARDPVSIRINGFSWEKVSSGCTEKETATRVFELMGKHDVSRDNAVFICQNPSFDRAFFAQLIDVDVQEARHWPYHWLDFASMYWALSLKAGKALPWDKSLSKDAIAKEFDLPPEAKPHRAMNGVDHLILCYGAVVGYPERPTP